MSRYDLTDFEWRIIEPLLPNKPRGVPRRTCDVVEAGFHGLDEVHPARGADFPALLLINSQPWQRISIAVEIHDSIVYMEVE